MATYRGPFACPTRRKNHVCGTHGVNRFNLEDGSKTEAEAAAERGSLTQSQLLDFGYLRSKNKPLYDKLADWCESHPSYEPQRSVPPFLGHDCGVSIGSLCYARS